MLLKENKAVNVGKKETRSGENLKPAIEDPVFNQQIKELSAKRKVLEDDSKKIAEEVKKITASVKQQAEVQKSATTDRNTNSLIRPEE